MENFKLYLAGFGFPDRYIGSHSLSELEVHKKGDIWRNRTGEKYNQNIFKLCVNIKYDSGVGSAVNEIIETVNKDNLLFEIVSACEHVELQVSITTDEEFRLPHIHLTSKQMEFLGKIGGDFEVHIT